MKKLLLLFIFTACSSSDEGTSIDKELLAGQWFYSSQYLCPSQNNFMFNSDGTYVQLYSGNSCDSNESDTYRYTGSYNLKGDKITFNTLSTEVIEEGTSAVPPTPTFNTLIYSKIITLDENTLTIERKYSGFQDYFDYLNLYRN